MVTIFVIGFFPIHYLWTSCWSTTLPSQRDKERKEQLEVEALSIEAEAVEEVDEEAEEDEEGEGRHCIKLTSKESETDYTKKRRNSRHI